MGQKLRWELSLNSSGRRKYSGIHSCFLQPPVWVNFARTTLHSPRYYYAAQRCTAARRTTAHTLSIPPTTSSGASAPLVSTINMDNYCIIKRGGRMRGGAEYREELRWKERVGGGCCANTAEEGLGRATGTSRTTWSWWWLWWTTRGGNKTSSSCPLCSYTPSPAPFLLLYHIFPFSLYKFLHMKLK